MKCRTRSLAVFPLMALAALVPAPRASAQMPAMSVRVPAPVDAACDNPRLPSEILDGPIAAPASPLPVIDATVSGLTLRLAVADDDKTRDLGLMCVTRMKPQHGMIFVFVQNQRWEFWMKNTLVPLDMVWVQPGGTITTIAANVPASTRETPDDKVARRSGIGEYVIELRAGEAAADHLSVGKRIEFEALHAAQ